MKENYESLLDTIYELEGLVHLAIVRGEDAPGRIMTLIREKINRLADSAQSIKNVEEGNEAEEVSEKKIIPNDIEMKDSQDTENKGEVDEIEEYVFEEDDDEDEYIDEDDEDDEDYEEEEDDIDEEEEDPEEEDEETEVEEKEIRNEREQKNDKPLVDTRWIGVAGNQKKRQSPTFSLNDRFLFIRELFGGDGKAFNKELEQLDKFANYQEAERHFLASYSMDMESAPAQAFLSVIEKYYQS